MQQTDNLLISAPTVDSWHRNCIDDDDDYDDDNNKQSLSFQGRYVITPPPLFQDLFMWLR